MAATIVEAQPEQDNLDPLPIDSEAATPEELVQEFSDGQLTPEPELVEDPLPDKYQGKSIQDVVSMHQEAERALGRQGSEVGELRKVVDQYITNQVSTPEPEPEPVDFFEDPEKAVSQAIEQHPEVKAARQASEQMQQHTALAQLQQKHPDMEQVLSDPKFAEWVQGSPMRRQMYDMADKQYNFDAADELIGLYKERTQAAQQTVQVETVARKRQLQAANTGSGSGANTAGARRIYRRADIIKLMKTDPTRYEALSGEIMQAYQEGRVK